MKQKYKSKIQYLCEENPTEENCGFLLLEDNQIKVKKIKNIHPDKTNNFYIDSTHYIKQKPVLIWHNHVSQSEEPSSSDLKYSKALATPFCIYSNKTSKFYLHIPDTYKNKFFANREYINGIYNCGTLIVDYFRSILKKKIKTEGVNFFEEDKALSKIKKENFKETLEIKKNDVLEFKIRGNSHFGIYLGNQLFFHQMEGTLPYKTELEEKWLSRVYKILRYKDQ